MPKAFKGKCPCTLGDMDATKICVERPALPKLQQFTFSTYKYHNTYKGLIGISPLGGIVFVFDLYPGSGSEKELVQRNGLLDLLEYGYSVMAERGFDIESELALLGIKLNSPPSLKGKQQLSNH